MQAPSSEFLIPASPRQLLALMACLTLLAVGPHPARGAERKPVLGKALKSKSPMDVWEEAAKAHPAASTSRKEPAKPSKDSTATSAPGEGPFFSAKLKRYLGTPYRLGGTTAKGMDCSGFTRRVFADAYGIELPHSSRDQSRLRILREVKPGRDALRTGDLLFFGRERKRVNHVGIYLSGGKFIHASRAIGVTISSLEERYWKNRLMFSRRLSPQTRP